MRGIPTPSTDCSSAEPSPIFPYRPRPKTTKRSPSLQRKSHVRELGSSIAWLSSLRLVAPVVMAVAPFMCMIGTLTQLESSVCAQTASRPQSIDRLAKFIDEASDRFALPPRWIRAVHQVESGGDEQAISPRGAMDLMQVMPGTWIELSVRYGLCLDPFDPRDNIAGTAYLKGMHDRFGSAGFLTTQVRRGMNSTSQRANRFHRKPWPTSRR
jgi:soluble lytic murein transglycosylase-like protein